MISRIASGHDVPELGRRRQVESGAAARSGGEPRQAGSRAAAVIRIGAEARARAAASAADARAAAASPERPALDPYEAPTPLLPIFRWPPIVFGEASSPGVALERFTEHLARAQLER